MVRREPMNYFMVDFYDGSLRCRWLIANAVALSCVKLNNFYDHFFMHCVSQWCYDGATQSSREQIAKPVVNGRKLQRQEGE